jgi:SAM-dependent methyltransferase
VAAVRVLEAFRRTEQGRPHSLPMPPPEMRALVGPADQPWLFDNPTGSLVYPEFDARLYKRVFDFGCGCGRVARQLILQRPRPKRYVGIDLHRGMVEWCQKNLEPVAKGFEFHHHDVFNVSLNPGEGKPQTAPFPVRPHSFSLVNAHSVFTHLTETQAEHYLRETARILEPTGVLRSTWFVFDKEVFPMMQEFQNALFINDRDPSNAVIFDRAWLRTTASDAGLVIYSITPPAVRGFQWEVRMTPRRKGVEEAEFPPDTAPTGSLRPPPMPENATEIGLDDRH